MNAAERLRRVVAHPAQSFLVFVNYEILGYFTATSSGKANTAPLLALVTRRE
jgi:hypothetical protein